MSALTYMNENEREVSLHDLERTCYVLCDHLGALRTVAITHSEKPGTTCEEAGLMMIFATSLTVINNRLFELKPRIE